MVNNVESPLDQVRTSSTGSFWFYTACIRSKNDSRTRLDSQRSQYTVSLSFRAIPFPSQRRPIRARAVRSLHVRRAYESTRPGGSIGDLPPSSPVLSRAYGSLPWSASRPSGPSQSITPYTHNTHPFACAVSAVPAQSISRVLMVVCGVRIHHWREFLHWREGRRHLPRVQRCRCY